MNLADIDTIYATKATYLSLRDQLVNIRKNAPAELIFFNSGSVKHRAVLGECKKVAIEILSAELEEIKTKLILYGVTDFQGVD